jgi:hypothetical protein
MMSAGACTLVDLGGLNDGTPTSSGDPGSGGQGTGASGGGEGTAGNGSGASDVGGSGGAGSGGAPASCEPPDFCDDFDDGTLGATWSGATSDLGTLTLSTATVVSPPNAFRASVEPLQTTMFRSAQLSKKFSDAQTLRCAFDFYLEAKTSGERAKIAQLLPLNPEFSGYNLNLWINADGGGEIEEWACFPPGCSNSFIHPAPFSPIPIGSWHRLVFTMSYGGSTTLTIDDALVASLDMYDQAPPETTFYIGAQSDGVGPFAFLFDNLVCEVNP